MKNIKGYLLKVKRIPFLLFEQYFFKMFLNLGINIFFVFSILFSQDYELTLISNIDTEQNNFTALIDDNYNIYNIWNHPAFVHSTTYLQEDKSLIVPLIIENPIMPISQFAGGRFQKLNWQGDILWDFYYYDSLFNPHHDIDPLPNGNILVICWEVKTKQQAENKTSASTKKCMSASSASSCM